MNKSYALFTCLAILLLSRCRHPQQNNTPKPETTIAARNDSLRDSLARKVKMISIEDFYMDDTEITSNEYRQFDPTPPRLRKFWGH